MFALAPAGPSAKSAPRLIPFIGQTFWGLLFFLGPSGRLRFESSAASPQPETRPNRGGHLCGGPLANCLPPKGLSCTPALFGRLIRRLANFGRLLLGFPPSGFEFWASAGWFIFTKTKLNRRNRQHSSSKSHATRYLQLIMLSCIKQSFFASLQPLAPRSAVGP